MRALYLVMSAHILSCQSRPSEQARVEADAHAAVRSHDTADVSIPTGAMGPPRTPEDCRRGNCFDAACLKLAKARFPDICIWPPGMSNPDINGGLNPCSHDYTECP